MSGFPVVCAGQAALHRPHSVQANVSRSVFQGSSWTWSIPNFSLFSKSIFGGRPYRSRLKK